jgi:N-methylhydantoinase A/oxoprolinase/acetone carboxylase beta subunit
VWSVNWGITVTRPGRGFLSMPRSHQSAIPAVRRSIWWNGQMTEAWWSVRESLSAVDVVGPAIIAEHTSTTFVPPGWRAGVDDSGNVILRREA